MIEKLLQQGQSYNSVEEPAMKAIIADFFRYYYNSGKSFLMKEEMPKAPATTYKTAIRFISFVFRDIKASELNKQTCLALLDKGSQYPRLMQMFWIYIVENGMTSDPCLFRLLAFKKCFLYRSAPMRYVRIILEDPLFDTCFKSSRYPNQIDTDLSLFSTYFYEMNYDFIPDFQLRNTLYSFMYELKYSTDKTAGSLRNWQLACSHAIHVLFEDNHTAEKLSRAAVVKYINESTCSFAKSNDYKKAFPVILDYLSNHGIALPDQLDKYASLLNQKSAIKAHDWINLANTDDLDRWYILYYNNNSDKIMRSVYINYPEKAIRDVIYEFLSNYGHNELAIKYICEELEESLKPYHPVMVSDFNYKTFYSQIKYFGQRQYQNSLYCQAIVAFYLYLWTNYNDKIFDNDFIAPQILRRSRIGNDLAAGYEIINYNPAETVPLADKWILCYGDIIRSNSMVGNGTFSNAIDFTTIVHPKYRYYAKKWLWNYEAELISKAGDLRHISDSLNYIHNLKTGKILSIFTKPSKDDAITINEIVAWKNWATTKYKNNRTANHFIYAFRNFINYLNDAGICNFESGVFYHLTHTLNQNYDNANALSNEELSKLAKALKSESSNSLMGSLCYSAFYIALETEFRPTQIFSLRKDCIRETAKKNEYVLVSRSKTSAGETCEYPITEYVKREIDEIIKATDYLRSMTTAADLKDYLFIIPRTRKGQVQLLTCGSFNTHLQKCCSLAGIPSYSISNLRDTHMTKAEEEIIRKSLSDVHLRVLTGHKNANSDRTYIDGNVRTMLEAVHGIIIGDVNVDGKVIDADPAITIPQNEVSHSCGYCSSKACSDFTYLDCMLCKSFVTTIDRLPYFYEQLKQIDSRLPLAKCPHDREDLVNIKRLLLYYIDKITTAKGAS